MRAAARAGMTTSELDDVGADFLRRHGARSAPRFTYGFSRFNLISVNEEIVHGVPGLRVLRAGDVVKIDVTAELGGYIADSAQTVLLAPVADDVPHYDSSRTTATLTEGLVQAISRSFLLNSPFLHDMLATLPPTHLREGGNDAHRSDDRS